MTLEAKAPSARLVRLLLVAVSGLAAALIAVIVYLVAFSAAPLDPAQLSSEERHRLLEGVLASSPGVHRWAYFEPRIGYTLRPDSTIEAWRDTFRSNEIGYRAPPLAKPPGTFRIVFAGDSWTYGMGVRRDESFPAVIERLANARGGADSAGRPRVEAWTLALPGYNLFNSLSALEFFWGQLQPDVVVVVPSDNDHESSTVLLPNGSLWRGATVTDDFGAPHVTSYASPWIGSFEAERRWQATADAVAKTTARAGAAGVPVAVLFVARWPLPAAHAFMELTGREVPYAVVDPSFTLGEWENPAPDLHGNPAANELYGELGYELLATLSGWEQRPRDPANAAGVVFTAAPSPDAWRDAREELRRWDNAKIGETFEPSVDNRDAVAGRIDLSSGAIPRASTLLVRRRRGADTLTVEVGLIAEPSLYPLGVEISLPSRAGGSRVRRVIADGDPETVSIALPIPPDIPSGDVIDVIIEAERAASSADPERSGRSLLVRRITQD